MPISQFIPPGQKLLKKHPSSCFLPLVAQVQIFPVWSADLS